MVGVSGARHTAARRVVSQHLQPPGTSIEQPGRAPPPAASEGTSRALLDRARLEGVDSSPQHSPLQSQPGMEAAAEGRVSSARDASCCGLHLG